MYRRLKASKTWEEWARLYISEHPRVKAVGVYHAMVHAKTYRRRRIIDLSEKLGAFLGSDRIESLQAKAGVGRMTLEKLREHRALRARHARLRKATRHRTPGAQTIQATLFSRTLIKHKLQREPLSSSTQEFFARFHVPKTLQALLERHSHAFVVEFGSLCFFPVNMISGESLLMSNHLFIKNGLLFVGNGLNGDPIAVDLATLSTGFLNQEEVGWDADEDLDVRAPDIWIDTGLDPGTFFRAATVHERAFPVDFFSARKLQESFKDSSFAELFLV